MAVLCFLARNQCWESTWLQAATQVHLGHSVCGTTASVKIAPMLRQFEEQEK